MPRLHYFGSDWYTKNYRKDDLPELTLDALDLLGEAFAGLYHIDRALRRLPMSELYDGYCFSITISLMTLCTYDNDLLTRLVFLAHDFGLRLTVHPVMDKLYSDPEISLMFHRRENHPSIEDALQSHRNRYPLELR
jgi:hypothetical protein